MAEDEEPGFRADADFAMLSNAELDRLIAELRSTSS